MKTVSHLLEQSVELVLSSDDFFPIPFNLKRITTTLISYHLNLMMIDALLKRNLKKTIIFVKKILLQLCVIQGHHILLTNFKKEGSCQFDCFLCYLM